MHEEILSLRRASFSDDNALVLTSMNNLAYAYFEAERLGQAEDLWRECLASREKVLGKSHPDTLIVLNNLTSAVTRRGQWAAAEALARTAVERTEARLDSDHLDTLNACDTLAWILIRQAKHVEAREILDDMLRRAELSVPSGSTDIARWRVNSGVCYHFLGQQEASFDEFRLAAETLSQDDPRLTSAIEHVAMDVEGKGSVQRAADLRALLD